jgi:hypothetical protein
MGYYYISKFQEQVPAVEGATGRIIMPSGVQAITLDRRYIREPAEAQTSFFNGLDDNHDGHREPLLLLDPQLYLATISPETCSDTCSKLVGYPWFKRGDLDEYDSDRFTQNEYLQQVRSKITGVWQGMPDSDDDIRTAVEATIDYQRAIGCSAIVLPSPLTVDPGTSYETELRWLDEGLKRARESVPQVRTFATVALSDICTFSAEPNLNRLLELLLDHISAREPGGVYLVVEQRVDQSYYISSPNTLRTILRLVSEFADAGIENILVSWVGLAGFVSLAAGADGWASGWYRKERRLKLDDHRDDSGGPAAPAYYSHKLCGEIHPLDLDRLRDADLLELVEEQTPWSNDLFRALRAGVKTQNVDAWTNHAARSHFNTVVIRETNRFDHLGKSDRIQHVRAWLKGATERAYEIAKLGRLHERTTVTHQSNWQKAFDTWATPTNDDRSRTHSAE